MFDVLVLKNHVQKLNQHILVCLAAKEPLEHEITKQFCKLLFAPAGFLYIFFHTDQFYFSGKVPKD